MNTTLSNCPKCGHTVNAAAAACTYCGTALSSGDSSPQSDEKAPRTATQSVAAPPLPPGKSPPASDSDDDFADTIEMPAVKLDSKPLRQIQPEKTPTQINEPDTGAVSGADDQSDSQHPEEELILEPSGQETAKDPEQASGANIEAAATKDPGIKPGTSSDPNDIVDLKQASAQPAAEAKPSADKVSAKTAPDDSPDLPETPISEVREADPSESKSPGAAEKEINLIQKPTPAQPDNQDGKSAATVLTADDMGQSDIQAAGADAAEAAPAGESVILLESAAAAADTPPSDPSTAPGENRAKTEVIRKQVEALASAEVIDLETATQGSADAQQKQEAAQALKTKKLKLAQAQALKQKKLKLAQAQALKQKKLKLAQAQNQEKAARLKAQALNKQKAAQAVIEKAHSETATGSNSPKVDNSSMTIQGRGANTKMLGLLKKYQGQAIGINYDNSADIKEAELVDANNEFFSVSVKDQKLNYNHPLKTILTIIEGEDGVEAGKSEQKAKFRAVIKVYPLVLF